MLATEFEILLWFLHFVARLKREGDLYDFSKVYNRCYLHTEEILAKIQAVTEKYSLLAGQYDYYPVKDYKNTDFFPLYDDVKGHLNQVIEDVFWAAKDVIDKFQMTPKDVKVGEETDKFLNRVCPDLASVIEYGAGTLIYEDRRISLQTAKWIFSRLEDVRV